MDDTLTQRLAELEQHVRRAADVIDRLRGEREQLQAKVQALEAERAELRALKQERKDVLAQVDAILKELDKLEL
jgi:phage shock protein A